MKSRTFSILNFLALNLLVFALYLNFVHTDNNTAPTVGTEKQTTKESGAAENNDSYSKSFRAGQKTASLN